MSEDEILKLLPEKLLEKAYDDLASSPAKEISKVGVDIVKTARLFLAPLQITATFQDRFENFLRKATKRIPEERQLEPPPEIVGPAVRQMQYLSDQNPLWAMFEELLTQSADSESIKNVHPSFAVLISQLSADEATLILELQKQDFTIVDTLDLNRIENRFFNLQIEKSSVPLQLLANPGHLKLYCSHLESLSLVEWPVEKQTPIQSAGVQTGVRRNSKIRLTEFGKLFASVCIPPDGFTQAKSNTN
ncbi:DUF4393 domain-containing protein [Herbaspirillum frisingense]|uniref:DUF4393 domain-containing protein n=1 Tax=Herbaspirillum frisingense TaxID=92645 RepID=A0ABU1PK94_9BURK|nr:DUF4393 domain-containing protein [Herbaspirillum frisingense]MDR6586356.1 hypothetical protein [Herbaspirillum frisingense]